MDSTDKLSLWLVASMSASIVGLVSNNNHPLLLIVGTLGVVSFTIGGIFLGIALKLYKEKLEALKKASKSDQETDDVDSYPQRLITSTF